MTVVPSLPVEVAVAAAQDVALRVSEGAMHDEEHVGLGAGAAQVAGCHLHLHVCTQAASTIIKPNACADCRAPPMWAIYRILVYTVY